MIEDKQNLRKMVEFEDIDKSKFEKLILYTDTAMSLPNEKQKALNYALIETIVIEDEI
jgi:hypothetical protein